MNSQRRRVLAAGIAAAGVAFGAVVGVPVVLEFVTADVVMGFNAPDFNVRADIIPGQVARVRLVPDKTGTFVFLCDIFCGDGHEGMSGQIHVAA